MGSCLSAPQVEMNGKGQAPDQKNPNVDKELFEAVHATGSLTTVERLLKGGANPNWLSKQDEKTSFYVALEKCSPEVIKEFIKHGAEIEGRSKDNWTPLALVVSRRRGNIAELLLTSGASFDRACECFGEGVEKDAARQFLETCLARIEEQRRRACQLLLTLVTEDMGKISKLERVLAMGANPDSQNEAGSSALLLAAGAGWTSAVQYLLSKGAAVDLANQAAETPLFMAALNGHAGTCAALLDHQAAKHAANNAAVLGGHCAVADLLLGEGNPDTAFLDGSLPLVAAAAAGHQDMVELLLSRKASVNLVSMEAPGQEGLTALQVAVCENHLEVAKLLLQHGANQAFSDGESAIHVAVENCHHGMVELLLSRGASPETQYQGRSMLGFAAVQLDEVVAELLLRQGASVDGAVNAFTQDSTRKQVQDFLKGVQDKVAAEDKARAEALHTAVTSGPGAVAEVERLLRAGAVADHATADGTTPLLLAARYNLPDVAKVLLGHGAKVDLADRDGNTPLLLAVWHNAPSVSKVLLENRAKVDLTDRDGVPPLYVAARKGHAATVQLLLDNMAPVDQLFQQYSPLCIAACEGHAEVAELLVRSGADGQLALSGAKGDPAVARSIKSLLQRVEAKLEQERQAATEVLHRAVIAGSVEEVERLLAVEEDKAAVVNRMSQEGALPLSLAVLSGSCAMAWVLLKHGALVDKPNANGFPPLNIAVDRGQADMVKLLLDHKAAMEVGIQTKRAPLFLAAQNDHATLVDLLVAHGAAVDQTSQDGYTPLMWAAEHGALSTAQALVLHGADISHTSKGGYTPLHVAANRQHESVVQLLLASGASVEFEAKSITGAALISLRAILDRRAERVAAEQRILEGELRQAVAEGSLVDVDRLLKAGTSPNCQCQDGTTPLIVAAQHGHCRLAQLLVSYGAEVNLADKVREQLKRVTGDGSTPLYYAALNGHTACVDMLLLSKKTLLNIYNTKDATPLYAAAMNNHLDVVRLLLRKGAKVEPAHLGARSALYICATKDREYEAVAECLIRANADADRACTHAQGAELNCMREFFKRVHIKVADDNRAAAEALQIAVCSKEDAYGKVQALLRKGDLKVNYRRAGDHATALWVAADIGATEVVDLLIKAGAQVDLPNQAGLSPLIAATKGGYREVVELLILNHAQVNLSTNSNMTALSVAAEGGEADVVKYLLEAHADVHHADTSGATPLFLAASRGHSAVVDLLIKHNAKVEQANLAGETPLYAASEAGHLDVVDFLLETGKANVHARTPVGRTALHAAAINGHLAVVNTLLANQADVNACGQGVAPPLYDAVREGHQQVVQRLLMARADPNHVRLGDRVTPLMVAAEYGWGDIVRLLVKKEYKARVNAQRKGGATALYLAAQSGQKDVVRVLLEHGAAVDLPNDQSWTPLNMAATNNKRDVAELLIRSGASLSKACSNESDGRLAGFLQDIATTVQASKTQPSVRR